MTAKEKADELIWIYYQITENIYDAKDCALILVNEIIEDCDANEELGFWNDVKNEIIKYEYGR